MREVLGLLFAAAALSVSAGIAHSADWPKADVDNAIADVVVDMEASIGECLSQAGTSLDYSSKQIDLNGDGVNEIEVTIFPHQLGTGASVCFNRSGTSVYLLISDGKGGWSHHFGYGGLEYHQRPNGQFADVEITGPGFCFPIWRYHDGDYRAWKVCNEQAEIFADVASWIEGTAAPRDSGEDFGPVEQPDLGTIPYGAPDFFHNDSLMAMDHRRGVIVYQRPKKSIAGTVKPGMVVFKGEPWDQYDVKRGIRGTAYAFKKGCAPAPYPVSGGLFMSWHTVVLKGAAPVWAKKGCAIEGYSWKSPNAALKFESMID
ncbi:hypothetical protein ACRQ1B_25430 [Rhizobium panacihumi]|uniref:hypothetical protein n=1 Tax=Rhizobium panacihumi TaxID=2008450 RepID=UPI003D78FF10